MPRPTTLPELAMEAQVALRTVRRGLAPLYEAAIRSHDHAAISEAHAIAATLRSAEVQARRLAGYADGLITGREGLFDTEAMA